jgi:hypothetical protein
MSDIRVKYSGLIALAVGLGSVLTGMVFFLIITRRLSPEELGVWALIGGVLVYLLISENLISFWSIRQIARKKEVGKTAITSSLILSLGLVPVYIVYVLAISEISDVDKGILMFGVLLLPVYYISNTLNQINTAHRPQVTSYGTIIFESVKTPIALAFVVYYDLGVQGVIITVLLAYFVRIAIQLYFAKNKLKNQLSWDVLKNWITNSWVSLYEMLPKYIRKIDVVIFLLITNSVVGLAYYHVSYVVARLIVNSSLVSQGLYPKLLADGPSVSIKDIFTLSMYFAVPLLAISIIFSKPALFALNPLYQGAEIIVILLAIQAFLTVPNSIFQTVIKGIEKVDANENPKFKDLIKSNLFTISTARIIRNVIYLGLLVGGLLILTLNSDIELVIWWGIVAVLSEIPLVIFWWNKIRHHAKFSFPTKEITKYSFATIVFVLVYFITSDFIIIYKTSIYEFLPSLIIQVIICISVYISITYLIDKKTRNLVSKILREIKLL